MKDAIKKTRRSPRTKPRTDDRRRGTTSRASNESILLTQDVAAHADTGAQGVSIQEIFGSTAGQNVSQGSDNDQELVLPLQTGKEADNEAGQIDEDISRNKNAPVVSDVVVPEAVPAVAPRTSAPVDSEPTLTSPAVVENEPADASTGNAPAEASGPDTVDQSAGNVETEDAPVTSIPVFALLAGLTPDVLRQLLAAAEQMQRTQGTENWTPQKRK